HVEHAMTKTALLKSSTAVDVVRSTAAKLPVAKPQREYGDFDAFVDNADKLVAFFKRADEHTARLDSLEFKWLELPEHRALEPEKAKQDIARANQHVQFARQALAQFPHVRKRFAEFKRDVKWYDRKELYERKGKEPWISRRVVSEQVAMLLASFQNSRPGTPKVFGRMMIEEVYAN